MCSHTLKPIVRDTDLDAIKALEQGSLDVGIIRGPVQSDQLKVQTLFFDPFVLLFQQLKVNINSRKNSRPILKPVRLYFLAKDIAPHYNDRLIEICARMGFKPDICARS